MRFCARARRRRRPPRPPLTPPPRPRARAGSDAATSESLTDKILDTNPILEAFGNAKTTRNKNSSRFGRYVLVQFSADNEVVGAEIRTFLLERSRVTQTGKANERSYHVLYQVVKGSPHCPEGIDKYRYLAMSGCTEIDGVDDVKEFAELNTAMKSVGLPEPDIATMWELCAAMLVLGNVEFGTGAKAAVANKDVLAKAVALLGVSGDGENAPENLLCTRSVTVSGEKTIIEHTPAQARPPARRPPPPSPLSHRH